MTRTGNIVAMLSMIASAVFAQGSPQFTHQVVSSKASQLPARDFWLTLPRNYEVQSGKYFELYVTSAKATTVNIQVLGGTASKKTIQAQEVWAYKLPLGWEVTTSGIVEDLGVHVWSDNADLNVNLLSRNPYTSDGMNIIPVNAWGTEYVVAAYASMPEQQFDFPSEFSLVSAYDATEVTITPATNIRKTGQPSTILYQKGKPFTVMLAQGQVVQFMATLDNNEADVTGTVIHSTKPVGVVGASQCPNIPPEYPYCDHICEMIPPVSSWGKTYHSIPFYNRKGGDSFVIIASKNSQTIKFNGIPVTTLGKYEHFFRPDISDPGTWTSNEPFFLAQYINSTEWPDPVTGQTNNGIGDPAMVVVSPLEQYSNSVLFQTPTITTGTGYTNYANILINKDAVASTTVDGLAIASYPSISPLPIPFSNYVCYRARSLQSGSHLVKSDSLVGVYLYGYGSYDSYAWNGDLRLKQVNSADTVSPMIATPVGDCNCARIIISDLFLGSSGLASVVVDTGYNVKLMLDPQFTAHANDSSFYDICVIQPSLSGFIQVSIYDKAGNKTTVTSRIDSRIAPTFDPTSLSIAYLRDSVPNHSTFTLKNTTASPLVLTGPNGLRFANGNRGFDLNGADLSDLAPNVSRTFDVRYTAADSLVRRDTLLIGDECLTVRLLVESYYGGPITPFANNLYDFGCILFGTMKDTLITIGNNVIPELTIDTIWVDDTTYFRVDQPPFPLVIKFGEAYQIHVTYLADKLDTSRTILRVITKEAGESHTNLQGCALPTGAVGREITTFAWSAPIPNPSKKGEAVRFRFSLEKQSVISLELFDMLGKRVEEVPAKVYESGDQVIALDLRKLAAGSYVFRYSVNGAPYSGTLTIR